MSERETFLARWSRRKHVAAADPAHAESRAVPAPSDRDRWKARRQPKKRGPPPAHTGMTSHRQPGAPIAIAPLFDLASLPPIESIAADTDIRAFLAPGVPPELARAALRRAWAADPKIRDFVGLADYDWDFNAPGSMAGFGPLEMTEELRQIAARIIGPPPPAEPDAGPAESIDLSGEHGSRGESPELIDDMSEREAACRRSDRRSAIVPVAAAQNQSDATEKSQLVVRPRHGGALPK